MHAFDSIFSYLASFSRSTHLCKFLHVSAEHESLPADAPDKLRRQSMANLEKIASELSVAEELDIVDHVMSMLRSFEGRKVSKRQTLPNRDMIALGSMRSMRLTRGISAPAHVLKAD